MFVRLPEQLRLESNGLRGDFMRRSFQNPILPGFYPDPSICRAGPDYYLVTSTFEYFPGLPIFHSRDLAHWRQLGHVINRVTDLSLDGFSSSRGLFAPTIRYHAGTFYVINTLSESGPQARNFIVTATDPAGPWSAPHWLNDAGFDSSLFFDDDGRVWYLDARVAANSQYEGQTEISLQELDLAKMRLVGQPQVIWAAALKGAVWTEAPHLYKRGGYYYLLTAEGGTAHDHAVMIARSATITGPYRNNPRNPILTHRHLGQDYPIVGPGHGDLVETQAGEWWMVLLAMRPYGGYYYNLGRETFLVPVRWEDDWPVVSPGSGRVELTYPAPDLPEQRWPAAPTRDHFEGPILELSWNFLRTPRAEFWSLSERPGYLRLQLRPPSLADCATPSFVGRRQQHINFAARTMLEFSPQHSHECAGLVLIQNDRFHFRFVVTQGPDKKTVIRLARCANGVEEILAERPIVGNRFYLKVEGHGQDYSFYLATEPEAWSLLAAAVDGRILSAPVAGGFLGAYIGLYASSNGQPSANHADFDWFEYSDQ